MPQCPPRPSESRRHFHISDFMRAVVAMLLPPGFSIGSHKMQICEVPSGSRHAASVQPPWRALSALSRRSLSAGTGWQFGRGAYVGRSPFDKLRAGPSLPGTESFPCYASMMFFRECRVGGLVVSGQNRSGRLLPPFHCPPEPVRSFLTGICLLSEFSLGLEFHPHSVFSASAIPEFFF